MVNPIRWGKTIKAGNQYFHFFEIARFPAEPLQIWVGGFQYFFLTSGDDPFWLICFKWVETTT